jgi:hypothetical protein
VSKASSTVNSPELIELTDGEVVVARGTRAISWWVKKGESWINARGWPGTKVEQLESGPGTVWECRLDLEVPRGTLLMRVESRPLSGARTDPFEYLERETRRARRSVLRTYFKVGRRGQLLREPKRGRSA